MKKSFFAKIAILVLTVVMVFSICACGSSDGNGEKKIVTVNKTIYVSPEQFDEVPVSHYEGQPEILLFKINDAVDNLLNGLVFGEFEEDGITIKETDTKIVLTRKNGSYCEIDFVEDTIFFDDYDKFCTNPVASNPHDLLSSNYENEAGKTIFLQRDSYIYTPGYSILIDLKERNIPLDIYEGKKYIPLQTFNDLFIAPYGANIAYNGKALFALQGGALSPELAELYYLDKPTQRTDALAEFNYNELCLFFDLHYGLQDEHGFTNGFDDYFEKTGLKEQLLSNNPLDVFNAMNSLTLGYIADSHSAVTGASPYLGERVPSEGLDSITAHSVLLRIMLDEQLQALRSQMMGEVKFYEKVGNTAYITFDEFSLSDKSAGYVESSFEDLDTIAIIVAAHAQITKDEEIENVVVDLSCNGGGVVDSAAYLVAWMLGYCDISVYDSVTGSSATTSYKADVNLDGVFDDKDTIADKNLYCIVSPASFSCGNYAPTLLKASGAVTIVGKTSGGGACVVFPAVSADGTIFCISSARQMSSVVNGSYYHSDTGVEPDVVLTKYESFFDRVGLTDYLNSLK